MLFFLYEAVKNDLNISSLKTLAIENKVELQKNDSANEIIMGKDSEEFYYKARNGINNYTTSDYIPVIKKDNNIKLQKMGNKNATNLEYQYKF